MYNLVKILTSNLLRRRRVPYPQMADTPPPAFRGRPLVDAARLDIEQDWAAICPSGAISLSEDAQGRRWQLDYGRCVFCGRCAEASANGAITMSNEFELAVRQREDLQLVVQQGDIISPLTPPLAAARLPERIAGLLSRSLHIRHLDAGSDNAADWELNALLGPFYDVQRLGIDFVASPRHADMLLVTGAVTRNLEQAVRYTYEATPEPRLVVALGTDACSGGMFAASYAHAGGVGRMLPVDVYIPGDPPRPSAIIFGLLLAVGRLEQKLNRQRG